MNFWERAEAQSFLAHANCRYPKNSEKRWVYVVYLLVGLRTGEIWGLKVCDMVEDGKTLFIRRQYNNVTKGFTLIKGKKISRVVNFIVMFHVMQLFVKNWVTSLV